MDYDQLSVIIFVILCISAIPSRCYYLIRQYRKREEKEYWSSKVDF